MSRPDPLVDILLAPLAPELHQFQRDRGLSVRQIKSALDLLAHRTLG